MTERIRLRGGQLDPARLGDRGVNIAEYHQARLAQGGEALAAISVDGTVPAGVREELLGLQDVCTATVVHFRGA